MEDNHRIRGMNKVKSCFCLLTVITEQLVSVLSKTQGEIINTHICDHLENNALPGTAGMGLSRLCHTKPTISTMAPSWG